MRAAAVDNMGNRRRMDIKSPTLQQHREEKRGDQHRGFASPLQLSSRARPRSTLAGRCPRWGAS